MAARFYFVIARNVDSDKYVPMRISAYDKRQFDKSMIYPTRELCLKPCRPKNRNEKMKKN